MDQEDCRNRYRFRTLCDRRAWGVAHDHRHAHRVVRRRQNSYLNAVLSLEATFTDLVLRILSAC